MAFDPVSAGVGIGTQVLGGVIGAIASAGDAAAQRRAIERAAQQFNIPLPVLERMVAEQLGSSAQADVYADPSFQEAQGASLAELGRVADSGGMTLEDKVNYEQTQRDNAQRAMAQRQAIQNLLAKQGNTGSGVSAAMQLGAAREQAERGALAGAQTAADARRRATQAILQRGQLAGQMRGQSVGEANDRARAKDLRDQYNASARMGAQQYNLGLAQQQFGNQMSRASGTANALNNQAAFYGQQADRTRGMWADFGAAGAQAAPAFFGGAKKTALQEDDPYAVSAPVDLRDR